MLLSLSAASVVAIHVAIIATLCKDFFSVPHTYCGPRAVYLICRRNGGERISEVAVALYVQFPGQCQHDFALKQLISILIRRNKQLITASSLHDTYHEPI